MRRVISRYLTLMMFCMLAVANLQAQETFCPFPKAGSAFWKDNIPQAMKEDYIALGNQYKDKAWTEIPAQTFAEFRTNGNRTNYEAASFGIRTQFACLVMAEIMQGEGQFIPAVSQGLHYFIEKEPWWGIPAHYPKDHPEKAIQVVDLFNAETASMLAWTVYMLGDEINQYEQGLADSIKSEIQTRFLNPTLYEKQGWKHNANNWNTWITSNWLECLLICETDASKRSEAIKGIHECLRLFLKGYPDDGGCEEGVGYWDRAGASFFESLYFMGMSAGAALPLTTSEKEKVRVMGQFITTMHIHDLNFVNFSDASAKSLPNINILYPYGAYIDDTAMMQFAAYIGEKYDYLHHPSHLFLASGNFPTLGRELMLLSALEEYQQTVAKQPQATDTFLKNSQIMVASDATSSKSSWLVAVKGGNNDESHNHNDIGNFVLYHDNEPVIIDLGRDTYTSQTFSNRRYEMMNNRSMYHNVPLINGKEQMAGKQYRAKDVSHLGDAATHGSPVSSSLAMDIADAYPSDTGVETWMQTITLNRANDCVESTARFKLTDRTASTSLVLMCYGEPACLQKGRLALQSGKVALQYDKKLLIPSWEKLDLPDGIMKNQWGNHVYRLVLTLTDKAVKKGEVSITFSQLY